MGKMFQIKASFTDQIEIETAIQNVRDFFYDVRNFIELMPNVESIHTDGKGITRWTIRADIPLVGAMRQSFAVTLSEESEDRVEWTPAPGETQNFLRYAADFIEKSANKTMVRISQFVELRRSAARELHPLAGLAGASRISKGMEWEVSGMIKKFVRNAKQRLENSRE
jgi:carbon monoxide dehydrogenase subunit G